MKNAFTLVEMIVVVSIVLLLAGIGVATINKFNSGRKVETAGSELMTQIKLARDMAITSQPPVGNSAFNFVRVMIATDLSMTATAATRDINGNVTALQPDYFTNKKISGVNGLSIGSLPKSFGFWVGNGRLVDASGVPLNSGIGVTVMSGAGDTDDKKYFFIDKSGLINEKQ